MSVKVKPLTTYLGAIFPTDYKNAEYDGFKLVNIPADAKQVMGKYEAVLTHAAYMSRLIYEPNLVNAHSLKLTAYNPVIFNTGIGLIRKLYGRFGKTSLSTTTSTDATVGEGRVLYKKEGLVETPCQLQLFNFQGRSGPFAGEKVLYVVFRGTVSIKSGLADVNAGLMGIQKLLEKTQIGGQSGTAVFANEITQGTEGTINSFSAHRGFVHNLLPIMGDICQAVQEMSVGVDRIIVTGHSLGGANATLAALVLAGFRRAGLLAPKLHCITFGAPKCLTDMTRNIFNSMLDTGVMTLDRVAGRTSNLLLGAISAGVALNLVPTIPPHFVHPGYMILKTEMKTQSRTGRSKQISELRQMMAGMGLPGWKDFNMIPTYPEFLAHFNPLGANEYEKIIRNNLFGTLYSNTSFKELYAAIKTLVNVQIDITQDETQKEASESTESLSSIPAPSENQSEEQAGGGSFTDIYKAATVQQGSNHIVYMCHKNISGAACHFGYMGISFNGVAKNVSLSREPLVFLKKPSETTLEFVLPAGTVEVTNPLIATTPASGGKRGRKSRKSRKSRKTINKQRRTRRS